MAPTWCVRPRPNLWMSSREGPTAPDWTVERERLRQMEALAALHYPPILGRPADLTCRRNPRCPESATPPPSLAWRSGHLSGLSPGVAGGRSIRATSALAWARQGAETGCKRGPMREDGNSKHGNVTQLRTVGKFHAVFLNNNDAFCLFTRTPNRITPSHTNTQKGREVLPIPSPKATVHKPACT